MAHEPSDVVACRSCGEDIVFLQTVNGKRIPVNADTVNPGDTVFEYGRHVSHFTTCDQPDRFRKRK